MLYLVSIEDYIDWLCLTMLYSRVYVILVLYLDPVAYISVAEPAVLAVVSLSPLAALDGLLIIDAIKPDVWSCILVVCESASGSCQQAGGG